MVKLLLVGFKHYLFPNIWDGGFINQYFSEELKPQTSGGIMDLLPQLAMVTVIFGCNVCIQSPESQTHLRYYRTSLYKRQSASLFSYAFLNSST